MWRDFSWTKIFTFLDRNGGVLYLQVNHSCSAAFNLTTSGSLSLYTHERGWWLMDLLFGKLATSLHWTTVAMGFINFGISTKFTEGKCDHYVVLCRISKSLDLNHWFFILLTPFSTIRCKAALWICSVEKMYFATNSGSHGTNPP